MGMGREETSAERIARVATRVTSTRSETKEVEIMTGDDGVYQK